MIRKPNEGARLHGTGSQESRFLAKNTSGAEVCDRSMTRHTDASARANEWRSTTFLNCATPIHTTLHQKNRRRQRRSPYGSRATAVVSPPQKTSTPAQVSCSRSRPSKDRRPNQVSLQHRSSTGTYCPSALSSWYCRQHHLLRHQRVPTALQGTSLKSTTKFPLDDDSTIYSGHTPTLRRFKHLDDSRTSVRFQAPITTPAAAELPALVISFTLRITSLSRVTGRNVGCMSGSPEPS
jgi:hypothetical protein